MQETDGVVDEGKALEILMQYYMTNHQRYYSALSAVFIGLFAAPAVALAQPLQTRPQQLAAAVITWILALLTHYILAKVAFVCLMFEELFRRLRVRRGDRVVLMDTVLVDVKQEAIRTGPFLPQWLKPGMLSRVGRSKAAAPYGALLSVALYSLSAALFYVLFRCSPTVLYDVAVAVTSLAATSLVAIRFVPADT
jgi:hypothetical protein